MKNLFSLILFSLMFAYANSQTNIAMTGIASADSSVVSYITQTSTTQLAAGGELTFVLTSTKIANTGTTFQAYAILQGSMNGTSWYNVETCRRNPTYMDTGGMRIPIPGCVTGVDTFNVANSTAVQYYFWTVNTPQTVNNHPFVQYRIAVVSTTSKSVWTGRWTRRSPQ